MKNTAVTQFSQISDDAVKWAASAKKGDKKVFETDAGCYVVYIVEAAHRDASETVDVRHILFKVDSEAEDQTKAKADAKKKAEAVSYTHLYGDLYNIRNPCIMDWN